MEVRGVEPGDPHNDQMLAKTRDSLREMLDLTVHPLIDQAEEQDAEFPAMMAVLATSFFDHEDYMPRNRMASMLALALFLLAKDEREIISDGKTVRK